ncbi:MAG TPA: cation diffusion facilitator family transporter [Nitrosopumilaceae archaeon]|nr:cation diffusion facilitator family transporter [Nitrosopumilaceae archaeon]
MSLQNLKTHTLKVSLVLIISAFVVELIVGIYSNSLALITDSIHAVLDSFVTAILLLAARWAIKPPDLEHTYGHGKIETMGGFLGGIVILFIAAFFIYESIERFQHPPQVLPGIFAIWAAVYTLGTDGVRITILGRALKKVEGSTTLRADLYHAFMDMGSTIVAIIGILLVTIGFNKGDIIAALVLGSLLVILSLKLIHKTALELTDAISQSMVKKVENIVSNTEGVMNTESVKMRRSGHEIFADVTISLSGAASFDQAHKISSNVEKNIINSISNAKVTVHFEPTWKDVPLDSKVNSIAAAVKGVEGVHNVNSSVSKEGIFISLHVLVDKNMSLEEAHKVSDDIEKQIRGSVSNINHITVHLEPYVLIPKTLPIEDLTIEEQITKTIREYPSVKKIGRVITLQLQDIFKIDIDCSFEGNLSIEKVHDITSEIEHKIRSQIKNAIVTIHPEPN